MMRDDIHHGEGGRDIPIGPVHDRDEHERGRVLEAEVRRMRIGPLHVTAAGFGARLPGRGTILLAAIAAILIGGAFLAIGLVLIASLAAAGAVIGGGYLAYQRVRALFMGHRPEPRAIELDPAMEIRSVDDDDATGRALPRD